MRALILLIILLPAQLWAAQFMIEEDILKYQEGKKLKFYGSFEKCEGKENKNGDKPCFDVSGFDLDVISIATVSEVDPTKPVYKDPSNITPCEDQPSCSAIITPKDFCPKGEFGRFGDLEPDGDLEAWCTKILSYATKSETKVIIDPAKKSAKDARLAEASDSIGRLTTSGQEDLDAAKKVEDLTPILKDMLKVLLDGKK